MFMLRSCYSCDDIQAKKLCSEIRQILSINLIKSENNLILIYNIKRA